MNDKDYMKIAIDISKNSKTPYGAIIVKDDKIIGRSDSGVNGDKLYHHAEYKAIQDAIEKQSLHDQLCGATIYSSCEPCLMCLGAILYEGITKIVFGATIQDSNDYYCEETCVSIKDIIKLSGKKVDVLNIMREEALDVIKNQKKCLTNKFLWFRITM